MTSAGDFRQHLEVETPEHVVVDYEIAGLGSRGLAALIDTGIILGTFAAVLLSTLLLRQFLLNAALVLVVSAAFFLFWGYFAFFEGFRRGQTPGKRAVGIRVMRETGHPVTFRDAAARNLVRIVDFFPPPYLLGALMIVLHPRAKRLGDLVAGTVVVRDRPIESAFPEARPEETTELAGAPELTDAEFGVLREFARRAPSLGPEARTRLAARLAEPFRPRYPNRPADDARFLAGLHRAEEARRRGRLGAAPTSLGTARRQSAALGDRLAAMKRDRWLAFQRMAERASAHGLDSFSAVDLPDFAKRYREVAADLARARTYRAPPATILALERIVAAGHNALYRDERKTWSLILRFFGSECPAAIIVARRYVLVSFLTFAVPAIGAYVMLRQRPALAEQLLPVALLERADEGARKAGAYAQTSVGARPLVAASIITNNVGVAFVCFASGVLLGVGSLVALAFNGALIGAASGHYANLGLLGYLWTFVAGHGVLELFAIWLAGAAGLLLGRAIIAPGRLTRRDAMVANGRLAMSLVGAAVVLLLVAGMVEGMISTSSAPPAVKLGVSGMSAVFLALYLAQGRHAASSKGVATSQTGMTS